MREQFQRAFSDLTASAEFVKQARVRPEILNERYELNELELRRLTAIVNQPGMECNCILYRANRLAPVAINLPDLCRALGSELRELLSEYWLQSTHAGDNFWVEANDFCEFVRNKIASGVVSNAFSSPR